MGEMKNTEAMARAVDAAADFAEEMLQNGKTVVLEWSIQELMGSLNPLAKLMRNSRYDSQLLIQGHATGDWGVDTVGLDRLYTHRVETEAGAAAKAEADAGTAAAAAPAEAGAAEAPRIPPAPPHHFRFRLPAFPFHLPAPPHQHPLH